MRQSTATGTSPARLAAMRAESPTLAFLERKARRRIPSFCYDFLQGGTDRQTGHPRNRAAFDATEICPRHAVDVGATDPSVALFGRTYAAPLLIAPVGMDGAIWPGAGRHLARTAAARNIPYMIGTLSATRLEEAVALAAESVWFQLYTMPEQDHRDSLALVARAKAAGVRVLALTIDIPLPARRVPDMRNRLALPFRLHPRMALAAALRPAWLAALAREGRPQFRNLEAHCPADMPLVQYARQARAGGAATWEFIARLRQVWDGDLVIKGIMDPRDAERARAHGADGIVVSNHGGRQFDAAPAPLDVLPAVRHAAGPMPVLLDGGVMSGLDILRAVACGADAVMVGRGFMYGLATYGAAGADFVADTLMDEFRIALAQSGALTVAGARQLAVRHPRRWRSEDFEGGTE
ncbi:alpha-hydroxy acid oxidase [Plastorhodobacter daqingensis]|uniref:Alpha-hydroxy acid oxidase n=1 Tax=Plastorhodobacter daqingensis TaxID=1387281 RepID=A0ABW2UIB5_9RHOB